MKNKFLLIAVSVFFLSSCSDMRYTGMQKVKQNPSNAYVQNESEKERISSPEVIANPTQQDVNLNKTKVNSVTLNVEKNQKFAQKVERNKHIKTENIIKNSSENPTKFTQKNAIDKKQTVKESNLDRGSWLWYIVVGLVFLLIGSIIGSSVGYILWVVGVILVIYGLLVLLEVL